MLLTIFYLYATLTAAVVSGLTVALYNMIFHGRAPRESVNSIKGELSYQQKVGVATEARNNILETANKSSRRVRIVIYTLCFVAFVAMMTFTWVIRPITRLKITKDVLTNNWVKL